MLSGLMKSEARVLGIDDAPFDKFKDKTALVVGCFFRGSRQLEGVLSCRIRVDGYDATRKLVKMVNECKFKPQIRGIMLDGLNMGGFNMVDIQGLSRQTLKPVIVVVRRMPDLKRIRETLERLGMQKKLAAIERAGELLRHHGIFFQKAGVSEEGARELLDLSIGNARIPEALRIAHIIGAGIVKGESRGRA